MQTRTVALIAGASAAVAMTVTGVTYASADAPQSASSAREAVRPASAPLGGDSDYEYEKDEYKKDYRGHKKDDDEIQINERTYSVDPGACISVTNFLFDGTFNIANNSDRVVEFFNGSNCNASGPVATVLPGGSRSGVGTPALFGGLGSFRVIDLP